MYDCEGSSTRLVNCTFTINSAYRGGGIDTYRSNSELTGCTFIANSAKSGGGLSCLTGKLTLTGCSFIGNSVSDNGGGIYFGDCDTTIVDCFVGGNRAEHHGGGIYCGSSGKLLDNRIIRCVITGNKAGAFGGGIYCSDNLLSISNCAVVGNFAERCGGLLCGPPTSGLINNCILWDNRDKEGAFESAQIYLEFAEYRQDDLVNYCCIKGLIGELDGIGNISAEPCFAETGYWDPNGKPEDVNDDFWVDGDYHLKSQAGRWDPSTADWIKDDVTSPCIDVGNPAYPIGPEPFPNGGVINMGAYGGTDEASESYFGEPVCETIVAGDINGDCSVDFLDLLFISQHWLLHEIGKASNPFPPDGAARVSSGYGDRLSWTAGVNAVSHDLYFGTDRMSVADAHRGSPEYKGNHSITRYIEWGLFKPKTTHYWRIDEIGYLGKTTGTVWSFTKID